MGRTLDRAVAPRSPSTLRIERVQRVFAAADFRVADRQPNVVVLQSTAPFDIDRDVTRGDEFLRGIMSDSIRLAYDVRVGVGSGTARVWLTQTVSRLGNITCCCG